MAKRRKRRLKKKYLLLLFLIVIIAVCGMAALLNKDKLSETVDKVKNIIPVPEVKKVSIVDESTNSRSIAVMINNFPSARPYHAGLQEAYIVYELIVEGGQTRYMALYRDAVVETIGSIRSARHYFLDYALENDAIYVHWGWSPEAESDISKLGVDNINGLSHESKYFYRNNSINVNYEHRGFTKMTLIEDAITDFKYRNTSTKGLLLKYSVDEIDLSKMEDAVVANEVLIPYSGSVKTSYTYDSTTKTYKRFVNGVEHKDYESKKQYTAKNIITYQVSNSTLTGDVKNRQEIDNVGSGTGYYISNGYAVPIKWSKKSRTAQTVYTYMDGTEISVNDGNTYIQIQPKKNKLTIE